MAFHIRFILALFYLVVNNHAIFSDSVTDAINQREQFEKLEKHQDENIIRYNVEKPELTPNQGVQCGYRQ